MFLLIAIQCETVFAQQSDPPRRKAIDPRVERPDERARPPSVDELLQDEIRRFDPLDKDEEKDDGKNDDKNRTGQPPRPDEAKPLPGSLAAEAKSAQQAPAHGPRVIPDNDPAAAAQEEYSGPAVLSRSYTLGRPPVAQDVNWAETLGISYNFNTGAAPATPGPPGSVPEAGYLQGLAINWAISGRRFWQHDQVTLALNGQYQRNYPSYGVYNGPNTTLAVSWAHVLSKRMVVTATGNGVAFSQNYTLQNPNAGTGTAIANANISASPNVETTDTGTKQLSVQLAVQYQKSSRLSFNASSSWFTIVRNSPGLLGTTGEQASGDINYRWNRKTTIGSYFTYSHYVYPHGFGVADTNAGGLIFSYAFNRSLQFRLRAGKSTTQSLGLLPVPLSPLVAALLGRPFIVIDAFRQFGASDISAEILKDFNRSRTVSMAYLKGISPGNGVFQAATQESIALSGGMRVLRTYTLQVNASRDSLNSASQLTGNYRTYNVQLSAVRQFRRGLASSVSVGYRYFDTATSLVRNQIQMSSGLTWSPGGGKLWPF